MQLYRLGPGAPLSWATSGVLDGGELDITKGAPTLRVYGTSALIFTPPPNDLSAKQATVRQGRVGPKGVAVP